MAVTRLKLPFGKMPTKFDDNGDEQWRDYCAVTGVNSDKPDEIVLIDLVLTGLSVNDAIKTPDVKVATSKDFADYGIDINAKRGLPKETSEKDVNA